MKKFKGLFILNALFILCTALPVYAEDDINSNIPADSTETSGEENLNIESESVANSISNENNSEQNEKNSVAVQDDQKGSDVVVYDDNSQNEEVTDSETPEENTDVEEESEEQEPPAVEVTYNKMWRLYNPNSGEHFYTSDESERENVYNHGWNIEGYGWIAPSPSNSPVYRLYNPNAGDHHYTLDASERDMLIGKGWRDEGIGWYSDDAQKVPVYREYNPNAKSGAHNFTTDLSEHQHLISVGWRDEGIAYYATEVGAHEIVKTHPVPQKNYSAPFYSQQDPRWSGRVYGGYTLGSTGCGCTSIAMILSGIKGQQILPSTVADYLHAVGKYNSGFVGNVGSSNLSAAANWGVKCEKINSYDEMVARLREGKLLYVAENPGTFIGRGYTHALVVYGTNPDAVTVLDPLGGRTNGTYSAWTVWSQKSTDSLDNDAGVTFFAYS